MKKCFLILGFALFTLGLTAQTKNNKLGISAGGGYQQYNGDLGNGIFKHKEVTWYGVVSLNTGFYLNKSFDIGLMATIGDYGYCQSEEDANKEIIPEDRCAGCIGRIGLGNLNSRMKSGGITLKYKMANGYLFPENSAIKPYVYFGAALNDITDRMKMKCVNAGSYLSVNAGAGFRYYINERVNLGYNLAFGFFTSDKLDYSVKCSKDMYMQNSLTLGVDLF